MRLFCATLSAMLCSSALAQTGFPQDRGSRNPFAQPRSESTLDQRLAALEAQAEALAKEISAIRAELKKANELKVIALKHSSAVDTARLLNEVFGREGIRVSVDDRTNSLIFFASKDRMDIVQALIARLDVAPTKK